MRPFKLAIKLGGGRDVDAAMGYGYLRALDGLSGWNSRRRRGRSTRRNSEIAKGAIVMGGNVEARIATTEIGRKQT